jgi:hypothetical protein
VGGEVVREKMERSKVFIYGAAMFNGVQGQDLFLVVHPEKQAIIADSIFMQAF